MGMASSSLSFLLQREEVPLSKLQNLLQVPDDDLAGHLGQERPELTNELAKCKRRAFGLVVPDGRTRVAVDEAVPLLTSPASSGLRVATPDASAASPRPLLLWRDSRPLSKLGNSLETAENDLARQFHEQRPELVEKIAQCDRRAFGSVERARDHVTVFPVHARDGELAELRAAGQRAARGPPHDRGRGRSAEEVDERVPQHPEKGGAGKLGSGVAARLSAPGHAGLI